LISWHGRTGFAGKSIDIQFEIQPAISEYNEGVYTIVIRLEVDGGVYSNSIFGDC